MKDLKEGDIITVKTLKELVVGSWESPSCVLLPAGYIGKATVTSTYKKDVAVMVHAGLFRISAKVQEKDKQFEVVPDQQKRLILCNTTIIDDSSGVSEYRKTKLTKEQAIRITQDVEIHSVIGHESTAMVFTQIIGRHVPVNRERFMFDSFDDQILALKVDGRLPEGELLTEADLEKIGYSFYLIERLK